MDKRSRSVFPWLALGTLLVLFIGPLFVVPSSAQLTSANANFWSNARIVNGTDFIPFPIALENGKFAIYQSTTAVTTLSAANTTVTLTLPAAGAGLFHYIIELNATRSCTTAIVGSALLAYTSTNLPGTLAWTAGNACAIGSTNQDILNDLSQPLKSSTANTATTIVAPAAGAAGSIRLTAFYYTAP